MTNYRKIIKDEALKRGISINKLCTISGVPKSNVFHFLNNHNSSLNAANLNKLLLFCGYEMTKKGK